MRTCDYCQTKIDDGYLGYDYYVVCEDCIKEIFTIDEFNKAYKEGEIFWTTWYDEED